MIKKFQQFNEELSKKEVDELLDKISDSGIESLSARERRLLNNHSTGEENESKDDIITEIHELLDSEYDGAVSIGQLQADSSPLYKDENQEMHLVEFFMEDIATVEVYGGYKYETHLNSYDVRYEELEEETLIEIRDLLKQ